MKRPCGRGISPVRGLTNHGYYLLNGMILQVLVFFWAQVVKQLIQVKPPNCQEVFFFPENFGDEMAVGSFVKPLREKGRLDRGTAFFVFFRCKT